jgi:hypothetical protein
VCFWEYVAGYNAEIIAALVITDRASADIIPVGLLANWCRHTTCVSD